MLYIQHTFVPLWNFACQHASPSYQLMSIYVNTYFLEKYMVNGYSVSLKRCIHNIRYRCTIVLYCDSSEIHILKQYTFDDLVILQIIYRLLYPNLWHFYWLCVCFVFTHRLIISLACNTTRLTNHFLYKKMPIPNLEYDSWNQYVKCVRGFDVAIFFEFFV